MEEKQAQHALWLAHWAVGSGFADSRSEDVEELAALSREDHYPAGMALFRMGQAPTRVHIIRSGAVGLSRLLGDRRVLLQILRPGDAVGDVPLFLRMTEPFDAIALEDTRTLSIDSLTLDRLLEERPGLARPWLLSVSARMDSLQARLMELLVGGLEARIASVLVRQAEHGVVRLSQSMLAEFVGGRRTSVNRVLKRLQARKLLRVRYGQVEILDEAGLAAVGRLEARRMGADQATATAVSPGSCPTN